ncbi:MAG: putative zinc-binding metallopeptidase [Pseudarcicella sp.]|nr:putative zinc-binding metallopeptidase [Pseudarcicella sp.]MBP6409578.1 putative zinc-binding metallopeptidase [Pseudarcicella sp.]
MNNNVLILIATFLTLVSCKQEETIKTVKDPMLVKVRNTQLDNWLADNFTKPYNIEVVYHWDPFEVPLDKNLVPPETGKIQPVMDAIQKVWIEPYEAIAGETFMKTYGLKQFILVGSNSFNLDGTITLGTAEGGRKVVIYDVNGFSIKNKDLLKQMLHTIHHEFGHILNQNKDYPNEYRSISKDYTSNWYNVSDQEAYDKGFITPYAMLAFNEDFVEMIALMLVEGKQGFDNLIENSETEEGKIKLIKKKQLVIKYYRDTFNIDFNELQNATFAAIQKFSE